MSDFMKEREREWKRAIEGDERRLRRMDRLIDGIEKPLSLWQKLFRILIGYCLPVFLVAGFFIGIVAVWRWIFD